MDMSVTVTFLGAAETVTGSCYLVSDGSTNLLVDCGIFQGEREWRQKNWDAPTFDPTKISAVLLTHAHIDHLGMLPRYYRLGLHAPVYCSAATADLAKLLLVDSGSLQEEEATFRAKHKRSRHDPPLPLYTEKEAVDSLELLRPVAVGTSQVITETIRATWSPMGHILGACSIALEIDGKRIVFSGDIGRYGEPVLVEPSPVQMGDLLIMESTYGDREHSPVDVEEMLAEVVSATAKKGGVVLIPSFAVGRTQTLLYHLRQLKADRRIPDIPVIVDSPMAMDATDIYRRHIDEYDAAAKGLLKNGFHPFSVPKLYFIRNRDESIKLNSIDQPMILISASGMLGGGRVLHHLKNRVGDPRNTVLFVGFQPPGSRGYWLKQGAESIRILGEDCIVRARIAEISGLSAHAGRSELLRWARSCTGVPKRVAITHGEIESARTFAELLNHELGWNTMVPKYGESLEV
jgi:metallo-beta-lactamase family protein